MSEAATHPEPHPRRLPARLLTESALSRAIVTGDRRTFAELFRRHQQALYGFCVSIVGNQEDAADALQNTMAKALQALPGERRDLKLKPWLFRVAHNQCVDILRARRATDDIENHELATPVGLEASVATRERLRQLLADLERLPERQRGALVMRELNGLSFDEIGVAVDASPGAAKQLVYEARCALEEQARGREMECDTVRQAISERDGRRLGGRRIRSHLRSCEDCADFQAAIEARQSDLRALVPPIPAVLLLSIGGMFGGSGGGGGIAGLIGLGGGGQAALGGGAMKAVAIVAVTAGVGAGTAGIIEGTRDGRDSSPDRSGVVADRVPSPLAVPGEPSSAGPAVLGDGRPSDTDRHAVGRRNVQRKKGGTGPGAGKKEGGEPPVIPDRPDALPPGIPGSPPGDSPGRSGEPHGNGATPSPGGPPAGLPVAAGKGQSQAEAHANPSSAIAAPPVTGRPADPGASGSGGSKKFQTTP